MDYAERSPIGDAGLDDMVPDIRVLLRRAYKKGYADAIRDLVDAATGLASASDAATHDPDARAAEVVRVTQPTRKAAGRMPTAGRSVVRDRIIDLLRASDGAVEEADLAREVIAAGHDKAAVRRVRERLRDGQGITIVGTRWSLTPTKPDAPT